MTPQRAAIVNASDVWLTSADRHREALEALDREPSGEALIALIDASLAYDEARNARDAAVDAYHERLSRIRYIASTRARRRQS